jgi:E3 ubiquitin-protein ligase HUWE1
LEIFTASELQSLVCGEEKLEAQDMLTTLQWDKFRESDRRHQQLRSWLHEIIQEWSQEELRRFFTFVTGLQTPPAGGCRALHPALTAHVWLDATNAHYPQAHTCSNRVDLPIYTSKAVLSERLHVAMHTQGFQMQ